MLNQYPVSNGKPLKVGIVCYPTYGGSGVVATELGLGLAKAGHEIHFITSSQPARLSHFHKNIFYHEVGKIDYPLFEFAPYDTALTSKLVDVARHENLDLLHVHYAIPHATVAYLAREILRRQGLYIPVVTTLHGTDITLVGKNRAFTPVVEFSINQSDGVTAVSQNLRQETYEHFKITNDIRVIPNFIDLERFSKADKDHFKKAIAPNGEHIIIHTSNFRRVKRVDDVVHIFKRINEKLPSKLLLVGDGPERQSIEQLCRSLNLCHEIRFLGKQDAIEELLAISDLFLIPSGSESFGLAALEAMACEVPVISSNAGGLGEVNIHGETGYLSPIGDIESMANYAIHILENPEILSVFRKNAFARAKTFDIVTILPQYEAYYHEIINRVKAEVMVDSAV
jgi:L-malate glycosyltransferase